MSYSTEVLTNATGTYITDRGNINHQALCLRCTYALAGYFKKTNMKQQNCPDCGRPLGDGTGGYQCEKTCKGNCAANKPGPPPPPIPQTIYLAQTYGVNCEFTTDKKKYLNQK